MNTPSTIREQAARIAERHEEEPGSDKWSIGYRAAAMNIAIEISAIPLPEQTKGEEGWRTMESAPKDGTWVLLWWPHWHHAPITGYFARGIGLWVADRALGVDGVNPTRWMPLPVPPASSIPSKKEDGK